MKCLNAVLGFFTGVLVMLIVLVSFRSKASDTTSVQENTPLQTEVTEITKSNNQCCYCCYCRNRNNEGGEQE